MNEIIRFKKEREARIMGYGTDKELIRSARQFMKETVPAKYSYNFEWLGRPIIQYPQDIVAMQELIWRIKPELIVETGIAHGGSLIFYASILELIGGQGRVLGVDIDIRPHNRREIEQHAMYKRIDMIEGSSVDEQVAARVVKAARGKSPVMVLLDSNHTHDHVLRELEIYSGLVTKGSYLVVFDSFIEDLPDELFADKVWGRGDNPKTAVNQFLACDDSFVVDRQIDDKLLISVAYGGYLKKIK